MVRVAIVGKTMRKTINIIEVDIENNVAFDDEGHILPIEDYIDEDENPCLPEEAVAAYVRISSTRFKRVDFLGEE